MRLHLLLPAAALAASLAGSARANVTIYYHAGGWDAFDGQGSDGHPLCGVGSRNPADGRSFSMSYEIGSDNVHFITSKPTWNIPNGTSIPVVVQVGLDRPWPEQAVGNGHDVRWTLDRAAMQQFDSEFRRASQMTVTFPSGNEKPWIIELTGSTAASNAMGRCITDLARRAAAPQPAATAPAQQDTTQPFGAAANAPDNTQAAQPAAPAPQTPANTAPGPTH